MRPRYGAQLLIVLLLTMVAGGCSTRRNTAGTRFYHAFTTRYNVYFNGDEAYKDGLLEVERQHTDNYLERISLFPVVTPTTTPRSKTSHFGRAIEKSQKAIRQHSIKRKPIRRPGRSYTDEYRRWLNRSEFNPYLHHAWMLLGKAHYHNADTTEAISTFNYIMRLYDDQPQITAEAGIWLARSYTTYGWYYEAGDMLARVKRDTLPASLVPFHSAVAANLLLQQEKLEEAVPYLLTTVENEKNRVQRARQYYLLGQVYQQLNQNENAYTAFRKVIRMNPPYQLELSARIRQTEVTSGSDAEGTIKRLRRMARSEKNKDYLDQIYYALGNLYLSRQDTLGAITEFSMGVKKSTRNGAEKGVLQLRLGNLFWKLERFEEAQKSYTDAIALLDKKHPEYKEMNQRLQVLDELVGYTKTIHLQDSLQHLASLSDSERLGVINKLIEETIRKEKQIQDEEKYQQEQLHSVTPFLTGGAEDWYFYNPQLVAQGKIEFERIWGRRKLEDNWRRKNKTVISLDKFTTGTTELSPDSIATDSISTDTKSVEYYLKQIPLTAEAMQKSNELLSEALYNLGFVYKDKLLDYNHATETFARLARQFPEYKQLDKVYYNLYLLSLRREDNAGAEQYKTSLAKAFPQSEYTVILADPDFRYNAANGKHLEDSLYADTYIAWQQHDYEKVAANNALSASKYPLGKNRAKFKFLYAMSALQSGDTQVFLSELRDIVQNYPQEEITEISAYILKGVQEGRPLVGWNNPLGNIWQRRSVDLQTEIPAVADSIATPFSTEKQSPHLFILAYESGTVDENLLLYEIARYNFSNFVVKNFDLQFARHNGIGMLQVRPFANIDEARQYSRQLYADADMAIKLDNLRILIISEENYALLLREYSFEDYDKFYQEQLSSGFIDSINLDYIEFEEAEE